MKKNNKVRISVDKLAIGMFVDLEMGWTQHSFLFSRFRITSQQDIHKIKGMGITEVCILLDKCDRDAIKQAQASQPTAPESVPETKAKLDAKKALLDEAKAFREKHKQIAERYKQQSERVKSIAKALKTAPANAVRDVDKVVEDLVGEIENAGELLTNLVNLGSGEHTVFNHNINVTVLSLMLGSALGLKGEALRQLAMGALLHDVGKIQMPYKIVHKQGKLTEPESKIYQTHPQLGRKLIERIRTMPDMALTIIDSHHELLDGSGYPQGLAGSRVPKPVQIVAICNLYDNLCNAQNVARSLTPKSALAVLYKNYQGKIDPYLLKVFIQIMGVYPPGTVVKLNDDSIGLVVAVDSKALLKPELLLYNPEIPKHEAIIINMQQHDGLEIAAVLKQGDYPKEIYQYLGIQERVGYYVDGKKPAAESA